MDGMYAATTQLDELPPCRRLPAPLGRPSIISVHFLDNQQLEEGYLYSFESASMDALSLAALEAVPPGLAAFCEPPARPERAGRAHPSSSLHQCIATQPARQKGGGTPFWPDVHDAITADGVPR